MIKPELFPAGAALTLSAQSRMILSNANSKRRNSKFLSQRSGHPNYLWSPLSAQSRLILFNAIVEGRKSKLLSQISGHLNYS